MKVMDIVNMYAARSSVGILDDSNVKLVEKLAPEVAEAIKRIEARYGNKDAPGATDGRKVELKTICRLPDIWISCKKDVNNPKGRKKTNR